MKFNVGTTELRRQTWEKTMWKTYFYFFFFVSPVKYQPFALGLFTLGRGQVPHAESFWPLPLPAVLCACFGVTHTTGGFFSGFHCFVPSRAKGTPFPGLDSGHPKMDRRSQVPHMKNKWILFLSPQKSAFPENSKKVVWSLLGTSRINDTRQKKSLEMFIGKSIFNLSQ